VPDGVLSGWPGDAGWADGKVRRGPCPTRPPPQGGASPLVIPPAMYFFPPCPGGGGPRATLPSVRASRQACGPNAAGRGDSHGRYIHRSRLNLPRWRHRPRCIRNSAGGWRPACGHRRLGDGSTGHTHAMGILRRGMPSRPCTPDTRRGQPWLPCWRLDSKQGGSVFVRSRLTSHDFRGYLPLVHANHTHGRPNGNRTLPRG